MVNLTEVRLSKSALKASAERLVAVFAGATSGIGESTLRALARNARYPIVYIIGRNKVRASIIIDECRLSCPEGTFVFVQADLSLLRNVDVVCKRIMEETRKLDILFMSQGYISFEGRKG
jgi:NAD(P)-dependent dehydrogenase (short-subunit alcohol dehydrogenase family)